MRLDSALNKVVPNISRPKKSRHFLMKLSDNFQMSEHSWPCRFHITIYLHSELINLIIVSNENFRFGKNRVIVLYDSGYTFYQGISILPTLKSENCTFQHFEYISTTYYNLCVSSIWKYTINEKVFAKHRKIKEDINNKRFPVRDISVNFLFGFGLHFLPTTSLNWQIWREIFNL